jgi:hypothetical protein
MASTKEKHTKQNCLLSPAYSNQNKVTFNWLSKTEDGKQTGRKKPDNVRIT